MPGLLVYGAYGYTGALIARAAARRGLQPILAGRNAAALQQLAGELRLEARPFALDDDAAIDRNLAGASVVLHCAGPFAHTAERMAQACLRARVHYLDITGEASVFTALAQRDAQARAAGVMLLPGAGFDVVPSDCLAAHLKRRLPTATHLALGFQSQSRLSRGTALTVLENLSQQGLVRRNGVLERVPAAWKVRTIDFGAGPTKAMTIPWGDVVTAHHSTGIPNIEVYTAVPLSTRIASRLSRGLGWLLASRPVQRWLSRRIRAGPPGPTDEQRARGRTYLWGEASDDAGHTVTSRLRGPEGYDFTVLTAVHIAERVLSGDAPPGFQTPATAYGPELVLQVPGVERHDDTSAAG